MIAAKDIYNLYEKDFYSWAIHHAELIRQKRYSDIDIDNIAEELESMGRNEKRELISRLVVLMAHLLKWIYQPQRRGKSWKATIEGQREDIISLLKDSPSLKYELKQKLDEAYRRAKIEAEKQTQISKNRFPENCPFTLEQVLDTEFLPD